VGWASQADASGLGVTDVGGWAEVLASLRLCAPQTSRGERAGVAGALVPVWASAAARGGA